MSKSSVSLAANSYAHFCIDFACFVMLFGGFAKAYASLETVALGFLAYNVIAFGLQPIIGFLCDRQARIPISLIGCATLIAGMLTMRFAWPALVVCAAGNACFHVGGGIDSLVNARGRIARSGVFVSTGALGVGLGTLAGKAGLDVWVPIALLGIAAAGVALASPFPSNRIAAVESRFHVTSDRSSEAILVLCLLSVVIRSYVGAIIPMGWKTTTFLLLLPSIAAFCGKAGGGFLADRLGARRAGVGSLLIALPLLVSGSGNPVACVLGIIMFNISMSITLCAVFERLPANPGLAFGLTTLALVCGSLPAAFVAIPPSVRPVAMSLLILLSALCLYAAVRNRGRIVYEDR